jgi:hypothetical protein
MSPDKALELVQRYARLNSAIKQASRNIGNRLLRCKGISGKRQIMEESIEGELDHKGRELDVHLTNWYKPGASFYGSVTFHDISLEEHGAECCHCYEAHLLIQCRKSLRQELGQVKRVMSRSMP